MNVIIVPLYKAEALETCKVFEQNLEKIHYYSGNAENGECWEYVFLTPSGIDLSRSVEKYKKFKQVTFDEWDGTIETYNKMCLSRTFYEMFFSYEYMLILQTDVLLLSDISSINYFINMGYGYIGAPWYQDNGALGVELCGRPLIGANRSKVLKILSKPRVCVVGNGGLSLRSIKGCYQLCSKKRVCRWRFNEDAFFAYYGQDEEGFLPSAEESRNFALELQAGKMIEEGIRPFGIHAWEKYAPKVMYEKDFIDSGN